VLTDRFVRRWVLSVGLVCCWASACQPGGEGPPPPLDVDAGQTIDVGFADSGAIDATIADAGFEDSGVELDAGTPDSGRTSDRPTTLAWEELTPGMPEDLERWGAPVILVPEERRLILFGGTHYPRSAGDANDVWSYDLASGVWTELVTTGDVPEPRYCHRGAYLPTTNEILIVGGRNADGPLPRFAATLNLGTNVWTTVTGNLPNGIIGPSVEWMPNLGKAIVFGGGGTRGNERLTWSYDPSTRTFDLLAPAHVPPGRADAPTAYDPIHERILMFGGGVRAIPPYAHLGDLWSFDGTDWTELTVTDGPAPRRYMASGLDPVTRLWVLFGGTKEDQDFDDLWLFDLDTDTFTRRTTTSTATPRAFSGYAFDAESGQMLVFGGLEVPFFDPLSDAWRLRF
jgi:hypothetical protein